MALTPIQGFLSGSYNGRSRGASAMRTANAIVEQNGPAGRGQYTMFPRAGKEIFVTLPTVLGDSGPAGPIKGAWANRSRVFVIAARHDNPAVAHLFEVLQDGTATQISTDTIDVDSNPVTIRSNSNQLMIVSAGKAYVETGTALHQPVVSFSRGYVSAFLTAVTWTDSPDGSTSDKFDNIDVGNFISFDNGTSVSTFTVTAKADNEHLTIDGPIGGPAAYFYQAGEEFLTASSLEYIDGYFIVSVPDSRKFYISNSLNGKIWDVLDIGEKLGTVDNIACVKDLGGQLALIGNNDSTEIWVDSGDADFPFARVSGRSLNCGTDAPFSVAKMPDGSLIWLFCSQVGREELVQTTGGEPVRISNHAFENAIRGYARIDDAVASTFIENGHPIYRIDFPTADRTWFFDGLTGMMSEIGARSGSSLPEVYTADKARFTVQVLWPNGTRMRLGFDYSSGKVWEISPDYLDDDGTDFEVLRIGPNIPGQYDNVAIKTFALDCELGTIQDGSTPKVYFSYSKDGAQTWSAEEPASLGRTGEFTGMELADADQATNAMETLPIWRGLGEFYIAATIKIRSTGKELRAVYDGLVEMSK